jgi:hypothetical protein
MSAKASTHRSPGPVRVDVPPWWIRCDFPNSRAVEGFIYEVDGGGLGVRLRDGSRYFYSGVPASVIEAFCESDSAGRFFNEHIKGKYPTVRFPSLP